jgi:hypothetical protein
MADKLPDANMREVLADFANTAARDFPGAADKLLVYHHPTKEVFGPAYTESGATTLDQKREMLQALKDYIAKQNTRLGDEVYDPYGRTNAYASRPEAPGGGRMTSVIMGSVGTNRLMSGKDDTVGQEVRNVLEHELGHLVAPGGGPPHPSLMRENVADAFALIRRQQQGVPLEGPADTAATSRVDFFMQTNKDRHLTTLTDMAVKDLASRHDLTKLSPAETANLAYRLAAENTPDPAQMAAAKKIFASVNNAFDSGGKEGAKKEVERILKQDQGANNEIVQKLGKAFLDPTGKPPAPQTPQEKVAQEARDMRLLGKFDADPKTILTEDQLKNHKAASVAAEEAYKSMRLAQLGLKPEPALAEVKRALNDTAGTSMDRAAGALIAEARLAEMAKKGDISKLSPEQMVEAARKIGAEVQNAPNNVAADVTKKLERFRGTLKDSNDGLMQHIIMNTADKPASQMNLAEEAVFRAGKAIVDDHVATKAPQGDYWKTTVPKLGRMEETLNAKAAPNVPEPSKLQGRAGKAVGAADVAMSIAEGNYGTAVVSIGQQAALSQETVSAAAKLTKSVVPVAKALGQFAKRVPVIGAAVTLGYVGYEVGKNLYEGNKGKAAAAAAAGTAEIAGNLVGFGVGDVAREAVREGVVQGAGEEYAPDKSGLRTLGERAVELGSKYVETKPEAPLVAASAVKPAVKKPGGPSV